MYNNLGINDIDMINSNYISDNGLFLPSHTLLTDNEIIFVCNVIKSFFKMPVLNVKKVFMTLTACNSTDITSPFYIKGQNNGIGNSLFQIASGLNYARKHNAKLFVPSLETYLKTEGLQKEDTIFRYINTDKPDDYNELQLVNSNDNREYIFKHKYYNNINFHNYFENINNIADFKKDLLELFSPSAEQIAYLISKYPVLQSTDNICSLHIRRGPDICSIYSEHHLKQIENYTFELLDYMIEKKNITNIFVLTNDRAYCNAILDGNSRYTGLTFYYSAERDYYDIWIISLIKNNIISASTLSWWGSFLNKYSDKFIIGHHKNIGTYNPEWLYI